MDLMTDAPTHPPPADATTEEVFSSFVAARWGALYRTAFMLTGERTAAEDLVQTALAKTFGAWSRVREVGALESYVRRTMVTTHTSRWRRHRGRELLTDTTPDRVSADADARVETVLARTVLWPHLAQLPKGQRTVVVLRFYEDLTETQAAQVMGCSVGSVKSQTSRALAKLRVALGDVGTGPLAPYAPNQTPKERG